MQTLKLHTNQLTNLVSLSANSWSLSYQGGIDMPCTENVNFDGRYTQEHKTTNKRMRS